jgi:hypothetical protein
MSRPPGSEALDLDDLCRAYDQLRDQGAPVFQWAVADQAGCSIGGLRKFLARHELTWAAFRAYAHSWAVNGHRPCHHCGEDEDMKAIVVPLDYQLSEALLRAANRSERHPRIEARRLLREALELRGDLPHRPRPVDVDAA